MCGICGQFNYADGKPVGGDVIRRMAETIAHRGPDDEGYHLDGALGLGFRRLSIIDLAGGHQPMADAEQSVWVVFNGEIYNFPELKKELEGLGHKFQTRSDTEVIIHGYKQWGDAVLDRLNGMFGFALWDAPRKRLLVARDRLGIKTVYYQLKNGRLLFGSEIRPILAAFEERPALDPVSLNLFLRYRYTPSPLTLFSGIEKLPAGTCMIVEDGAARVERYWRYKPEPFDPMPSPQQAQAELRELYERAVKRQLISDVPLGLLLSGGLDSGLLLALMNLHGDNWPTFSVGFGKSFARDELETAAETARLLGATNASTELDRATFEATLPKIAALVEEPIASSSMVPMYHVCERARRDVKVALMGQGPDELFCGYKRHLGVRYGGAWRALPGWLRAPARGALKLASRSETIHRGLESLDEADRLRRFQQVFSIMPAETIDGLFQDDLLPQNAGDKIIDCWADLLPLTENLDELGAFNYLEVRSSLPDELLMYGDKLSMAHGLEVRVPYLDYEVVEYAERLAAGFKVRGGKRKWLHRRVCEEFLPPSIINRKKQGFAVKVVDDWFRNSLSGKTEETLLDGQSLMYAHLRRDVVADLVQEHQAGRRDNHKIMFSLIVLEEWLRNLQGAG